MSKMPRAVKTELFVKSGSLDSIYAYRDFVSKHPFIEVISVNMTEKDHVLLTYYTH